MATSRHILKTFLKIILFLVFAAITAKADTVIRAIPEIRRLIESEGSSPPLVDISAHVLRLSTNRPGFFVSDGTKGIYVKAASNPKELALLKPGDLVRIQGQAKLDGYSPSVISHSIEITGSEDLPDAAEFLTYDYFATENHCDWVRIKGILLSMSTAKENNAIRFEVEKNNMILSAQIPYSAKSERELTGMLLGRVEFKAVAGTIFNGQQQTIDRLFYANSVDKISRGGNFTPSPTPDLIPMSDLLRFGYAPRKFVRIQGTLTQIGEGEVFLRDGSYNLMASLSSPTNSQVGDRVELSGIAWPRAISPAFRARTMQTISKSPTPAPTRLRPGFSMTNELNYSLVEIESELIEIGKPFASIPSQTSRINLLCQTGDLLFEAKLPPGQPLPDGMEIGSILRLTGICKLTRDDNVQWQLAIEGMQLDLRAKDGIMLLKPPPWWTTRRLFLGLLTAVGLAAFFLFWTLMLRKTVDRQTLLISHKIERTSILEERQRVARELHDNLEQGLAGMAVQLRSCTKLLDGNFEKYRESMTRSKQMAGNADPDLSLSLSREENEYSRTHAQTRRALLLVRDMLTHCSRESRSAIEDLRGSLLESMALPDALETTLKPMFRETGISHKIIVNGAIPRFRRRVERNLLLIIKEAAVNSVRHSFATEVEIILAFTESNLSVSIKDNGRGFDHDTADRPGHFGIQGMRERAGQIGASVSVESQRDHGTAIRVELPVEKSILL